jgi:hypothetical protein
MAKFTGDNKSLTKFLEGFGKDLQDIALRVTSDRLEAAVGKRTHYLRRRLNVKDGEEGTISISDLPKVISFLKATKVGDVIIQQMERASSLHLSCGNSKLQVPTSTYLHSQSELPLIEKLIKKSEANMWQSWDKFPMNYHGHVNGIDFDTASKFSKVITGKFTCKTEFDTSGTFIIRAGNKVKGKMFVKLPMTNVEGGGNSATSTFAHWLPTLLESVPEGTLLLHTGDNTILVIEQPETGYLLVIMDQDCDEED